MKNKYRIKNLLLLIMIFFTAKCCLEAKSWPRFMHDETRSGYIYEQAGGTLTYKWSYNTFSNIICSPVIKDGNVYIGNRAGSVYAFSLLTEEVVWQESLEDPGWIDSTPVVEDGDLYVFSRSGDLYSYNAADGSVNWSVNIGGQNISSPLVLDGYIYTGRGSGKQDIIGVDVGDGSIAYSYDIGESIWSSPVLYGNYIYIGSNDGAVHKLDKELNKIWKYDQEWGMFRLSCIAAQNDILYFAPGDTLRKVYAIDIEDPHNNTISGWPSDELNLGGEGVFTSAVAIGEDKVYVVMSSTIQVLCCLDKSNGDLNWKVELGATVAGESYVSSPAVTYDTIYVGSENGYMNCVSTTGSITNRYIIDSSSPAVISSPAVSDGYVCWATQNGKVYVYRASNITSISSPDDEDIASGSIITVTGSAKNPDFQNYTLDFGTGTDPSNWHFISSATTKVNSGTLGYWNVSALLDGVYTLRLTANSASNPGEARNYITLNNPPEAPTSVAAASTPFGQIKIDWVKSADDSAGDNDVAGYKLFRKTEGKSFNYNSAYKTVSAGVVTYTDTDVELNKTYYYVLRSYDLYSDSENSLVVSTAAYKNTVSVSAGDGGTVELSDGTGVYFPPGALKQDSDVAVTIVPASRIPEGDMTDNNWRPVNRAWEFEVQPDNTFNKNVTVKLSYTDTDVAGMDKENLRVYWYDETAGIWRMVDTSVPMSSQNQVYAYVPHFTMFRIAQYIPPEYIISKDSAYVYPNPAEGNEVTFKFRLMKAAEIELQVFNVAGELIKEFSQSYLAEDAGKTQEISWDISGIASGVYLWYLKGETSGREDKVIKKLAIIK